jgi:hypothetical protein
VLVAVDLSAGINMYRVAANTSGVTRDEYIQSGSKRQLDHH